jgi:nicotinamide-nucleotide amidase
MRCEVVAIGTELLLGQIVDTNSSWIGEQLALSGIDSLLQTKVGDNVGRIVSAIDAALSRADAVICCGGLGPTHDDLTRQALAEAAGVELVFDEDRADVIRWMFRGRDRNMPDNNLAQAYRPATAEFLETQPGTAPGLRCPLVVDGVEKVIYAVPGVPWEMKEMMQAEILPELRRRSGFDGVIASRTLKTWGESESGLAERLDARIRELDASGTSTIAFLASGIEGLKVRITAKADSVPEVEAVLAAEEGLVRAILGDDLIFGVDDETMESVVLDLLRSRGLTLGVAESLTGGLIGARLCSVPGASDVFRGGVISYASEVKFELLGVAEGPVVTEEAAAQMAVGVRRVVGSDVGIAATGVAGPDEQEGRAVGTVCLAIAIGDEVTTLEVRLPGQRNQVREFTVITLLSAVRRALLAE